MFVLDPDLRFGIISISKPFDDFILFPSPQLLNGEIPPPPTPHGAAAGSLWARTADLPSTIPHLESPARPVARILLPTNRAPPSA